MCGPGRIDPPQEIIDLIIFELRHEESTLTQCSLVSRMFLRPCRAWLFHWVVIFDPEDSRKFHSLLTANPELASHVRELDIYAQFFEGQDTSSDEGPNDTFSIVGADREVEMEQWILTEESLASIFSMLPFVTSFSLLPNLSKRSKNAVDWNDFSPALKSSVFRLLAAQYLRNVTFNRVKNLPFACFNGLSRVKLLVLQEVSTYVDVSVPITSVVPKMQLELLHISTDWSEPLPRSSSGSLLVKALKDRDPGGGISRLRELTCDVYDRDTVDMASQVVQDAAEVLQFLAINFMIDPQDLAKLNLSCINLSLAANLRLLLVHSSYLHDEQGTPFRCMINALRVMARTSRLEHMCLIHSIGFFRADRLNRIEIIDGNNRWGDLDNALSDFHSCLKGVKLVFATSFVTVTDSQWLTSHIVSQMPLMQATHRLGVRVTMEDGLDIYEEKQRALSSRITPDDGCATCSALYGDEV